MRPRQALPIGLLLLACGDSGEAASDTMLTTATASATATANPTTTSTTPTTTDPTTSEDEATSATTSIVPPSTSDPTTTTTTSSSTTTTTAPVDDTTTTGETTTSDTTSSDTTAQPPECGDGVVEGGETCDDAVTADCSTTHDGGDGTCVPAGTCSPGYVLSDTTCVQELVVAHVHVMVSNTCDMQVDPLEFSVEPGQKLKVEYHNHSVDYPIDIWMQYNGGFLDLEPGGTWKEQYEHCFGPNPSEGWADISTACSEYHLPIHCL